MVVFALTAVDDGKFFEAAQALAQSLSQWSLLIIGGSLVIIVSTSYYRPRNLRVRAAYFLFIPAWLCLGISVYEGTTVQRSYVAYIVASRNGSKAQVADQIAEAMADATRKQILSLEIALAFAAVWLFIYLIWWVTSGQHAERVP